MEGGIEKHTMSCGQDTERETYTLLQGFKGVHIIWNTHNKQQHAAIMQSVLRFQGAICHQYIN